MAGFQGPLFGNLIICLAYLLSLRQDCKALHIGASPRANTKCKEVLTTHLECPSIGSYPVAGVCDYFSRCVQTENGVESEVDFCPDGQIYVVNRCIKSKNPNDCPQKSCAPGNSPPEKTTQSSIFPLPTTSSGQTTKTTFNMIPFVTKRPLPNLHPSRPNEASEMHRKTFFVFLFPTSFIIINRM